MARKVGPSRLRWLSHILPDGVANWTIRRLARQVRKELGDAATDRFLEFLLRGMHLAFDLCKSYRRNIECFDARYVFKTRDGGADVTADFADGDMQVHDDAKDQWTVRVTFANAAALRTFLFAGNHDILNSILANEVEVEGNVNYLYKFGFMARDLMRRLGLD